MGNGLISSKLNDEDEILTEIMPSYYIAQCCETSTRDIDNVRSSWDSIISQGGARYKKMKSQRRVHEDHSCLRWFYDMFFYRVHTLAINCPMETRRDAFSKSHFLVTIILCMLSADRIDDTTFQVLIQSLLSTMDEHSMTFHDLCTIGGVLFSTLADCLGNELSSDIKYSWMKLYSAVLRYIALHFARLDSTPRTSDMSSTATNFI